MTKSRSQVAAFLLCHHAGAQEFCALLEVPNVSALGGGAGGAGADKARHYFGLAFIRSEEVDRPIVAAFGALDVATRHGGVEDVIEVGHVLLGSCIVKEIPTCSSLL